MQVIDHPDVGGAERLLECESVLRTQRGDKAVHELLRGEIQHLALGGGVASPCQRLQQVRLAEPDARVDIERIEHDDVASPALCDLLTRGMVERIAASDHERLEREARIEWRTPPR